MHIHYRTIGLLNLANTHPFQRGRWVLAQNGGLGAYWHKRIVKEVGREEIHGDTSSERLLAWLYHWASHLEGAEQEARVEAALVELCATP